METASSVIRKSRSKQAAGGLAVIVLLLFVWISNCYGIETPEAPAGYSWIQVKEIKAAFLVPITWHFSSKQVGDHSTFFIREEQDGDSVSAQKGLTIVVRREGGKKGAGGFVPSEFAATMMKEIQNNNELEKYHEGKQGPFYTFRFQYVREVEKKGLFREYNLFIANDTTGTLYTIVFSAPLDEWYLAWQIGSVILQNMIIDDEV